MLTGIEDEEEVIKAFDAGVDDYVTKPIKYLRAFEPDCEQPGIIESYRIHGIMIARTAQALCR